MRLGTSAKCSTAALFRPNCEPQNLIDFQAWVYMVQQVGRLFVAPLAAQTARRQTVNHDDNKKGGIVTQQHMEEILALVRRSGLDADVEVVPSIQEWCKQHDIKEENWSRTGKTLKNLTTGRHLILLPEVITDEMSFLGLKYTMEFRRGCGSKLAEPLAFLRHLVFHEISHGLRW